MATDTNSASPSKPSLLRRFGPIIVVAALGVSLYFFLPSAWRRTAHYFTGQVQAQGSTFHLHPTDTYLTQVVLWSGEYEPMETGLVRERLQAGDTFIDVGANIGWYTVLAGKVVGPTGKVVAFEPDPDNFDLLQKNAGTNGLQNVILEKKGLSNAAGSFKLYLDRKNLGRHSLVLEYDQKDYVEVPTVRFDDYWKGKGPVKLIKIDTEGAEGMILDGMWETIKNNPEIELIVEFAPERLQKSGYPPDQLLDKLYQLGFKARLIDEFERRIVDMGTPRTNDFGFIGADPVTNLHFKR